MYIGIGSAIVLPNRWCSYFKDFLYQDRISCEEIKYFTVMIGHGLSALFQEKYVKGFFRHMTPKTISFFKISHGYLDKTFVE